MNDVLLASLNNKYNPHVYIALKIYTCGSMQKVELV